MQTEDKKEQAVHAVQDGEYSRESVSEEELKQGEAKAKFLGEMAKNFREILALVKDVLAGRYKLKTSELAIFIGGIVYVITPTDLIPDWIPVIGWLDDIAVIGWIVSTYEEVITKWKVWKNIHEEDML